MNRLLLFGALVSAAAASQAVTLVMEVNLSNAEVYGGYGSALNFQQTINLDTYFGANYSSYTLTGIGYDVEYATEGLSSLNEVVFSVETSDSIDFFDNQLFPDQNFSGVASLDTGGAFGLPVAGTAALGAPNGFAVLSDDTVNVLLYDLFDENGRDGVFRPGSRAYVRFEAVPEPASMAALGLGVVALLRRRKM